MSAAALAPLPWSAVAHPDYHGCRVLSADGRAIADFIQRDPHPKLGQGITQEQAEAHARLFVAAPELLQALQALYEVAYYGLDDAHEIVLAAAKTAISKATGAQP